MARLLTASEDSPWPTQMAETDIGEGLVAQRTPHELRVLSRYADDHEVLVLTVRLDGPRDDRVQFPARTVL